MHSYLHHNRAYDVAREKTAESTDIITTTCSRYICTVLTHHVPYEMKFNKHTHSIAKKRNERTNYCYVSVISTVWLLLFLIEGASSLLLDSSGANSNR